MNKLERFATIGIVTSAMIASYMPNVMADEEEPIKEVTIKELSDEPTGGKILPDDPGNIDDPYIFVGGGTAQEETYDKDVVLPETDDDGEVVYVKDKDGNEVEGSNGERFIEIEDVGEVTMHTKYNEEMHAIEVIFTIPDLYEDGYVQGDLEINLEDALKAGEEDRMLMPQAIDNAPQVKIAQEIDKQLKDIVLNKVAPIMDEPTGGEHITYVRPHNVIDVKVVIKSYSGHTYQYKEGSLVVEPNGADQLILVPSDEPRFKAVVDEATEPKESEDIPKLPNIRISMSKPIMNLFDEYYDGLETKPENPSYNANEMEKALTTLGYTGDHALSSYLLKYYNDKLETKYTSFTQLMDANGAQVVKELSPKYTFDDITVTVSDDSVLTGALYDYLFNELFYFRAFDEEEMAEAFESQSYTSFDDYITNHFTNYDFAIGDYLDKNSDAYKEADKQFAELLRLGRSADDAAKESFLLVLGFFSDKTEDARIFMGTRVGYNAKITLEQVDGTASIINTDENNEPIDATYNLYYVNVEDNGKQMYYSFNDDGEVTYTDNKDLAAVIVTTGGKATVNYLLPNTYYLKEILNSETNELDEEAIAFEIKKGTITEVEIREMKSAEDPDPVDPTPSPIIIIPISNPTTPVVTPEEPEVVEEEVTPEGPAVEEPEIIEDEDTALADTGTVSTTFFYGLGSMLVALGAAIRRRFHK